MSDRDNAASDIGPGSVWDGLNGGRVTVLNTGGGYVRVACAFTGFECSVHHFQFRRAYRPLYDRVQVRSQYNVSCANLGEFRVYWNPAKRKIIARSLVCQRAFAVPAGAVLIGTYGAPFSPEEFLNDLDCLLATHDHANRAAAGV